MPSSSLSRRTRRRSQALALVLSLALLTLSVGVWGSPPIHTWASGPTPAEVALATEQARAADLKRQLDDANAKLRQPRPIGIDLQEKARADDLKRLLATADSKLAAPRPPVVDGEAEARAADLKTQLDTAEAKLETPRPPLVDGAAAARAADLARQNDDLETQLTRPRPVIEPPVVANLTKAQILAARAMFGLYTAQSPFSYAEIDLDQSEVNRTANVVGYFQSWQDPFRADGITLPWKHGQIPLMTWEPQPQIGNITSTAPEFSLATIINGGHDDYIRSYAQGIKALGLPVIIRFAHEMNGTWYPWSEVRGWDNGSINGNHKGDYIQAWRHVHDIFATEGANDYTIWLWSPNRINQIPSQPAPAAFYPGDDYVDWIGLSGYYRPGDAAATFANTYGPTLPLLRATGPKPIFLSEIGATETGDHKAAWIQSLFAGLAANPDIAGFAWFSLAVTAGGETNDWRVNSSGGSSRALRDGLAAAGWGLPKE